MIKSSLTFDVKHSNTVLRFLKSLVPTLFKIPELIKLPDVLVNYDIQLFATEQ